MSRGSFCNTGARSSVRILLSKSDRFADLFLPQNLELLLEYLGTSDKRLLRIPPNWNFSWRTVRGTGEWRLIVVSPLDAISFIMVL